MLNSLQGYVLIRFPREKPRSSLTIRMQKVLCACWEDRDDAVFQYLSLPEKAYFLHILSLQLLSSRHMTSTAATDPP